MQASTWGESDAVVNGVVTVTKPAEFGRSHRVTRIQASLSGGSTTEEVVVTINAIEVFRAPINPDSLFSAWEVDLFGGPNEAVVATLDDGGPFNQGTLVLNGKTN